MCTTPGIDQNIQLLCKTCNELKSNLSVKKFKKLYINSKNDSFMPTNDEINELKSKWDLYFPEIDKI